MKNSTIKNILSFAFISLLFINLATSQSKKIDLQNSNLEGVKKDGGFYWWKNQAIEGAKATYSVEESDVNKGSKKALKAQIHVLGDKAYFVSSQFNQKFKGKTGDEVTVQFYAKKSSNGNAKLKLVTQSDVAGSFQGKDFSITEEWQPYTHTFTLKNKSKNNQIKFWYMNAETTYFLDDLNVKK